MAYGKPPKQAENQARYVRESAERIRKAKERKQSELREKAASDRRARRGLPAEEYDPHFSDASGALKDVAGPPRKRKDLGKPRGG